MNIKHILLLTVTILGTSGIAYAAQDEIYQNSEQTAPYVTATQSGTIEFTQTGKAIIHDIYLVAQNNPVQSTSPAMQAVRGAIVGTVVRSMHVTSTGYNSEVAQTDSSPFIAADGTHVFDGMVAANFLPFGTKIKIPDYFGDKVFTVHDRMAKRFSDRVDVWFEHKPDAIQWGRRTVRIEILGS